MRQIFEAELKQVGDDLAEMSRLVEQAIVKAGMALLTADIELAQQVVAQDQAIDELERDLDERCVLLLAQQQPVATDLRDPRHRSVGGGGWLGRLRAPGRRRGAR